MKRAIPTFTLILALAGVLFFTGYAPSAADDNIISDIVSAPVVTNGIMAGEPTEFNILLRAATTAEEFFADHAHFGQQIPAGGWLEMELGGSFARNGVDNAEPFVPVNSNTHLIITTGHPQNPIVAAAGVGVQHGNYTIEDDGNKVLTIRPKGGTGANGLENARAAQIGFKVIHIRPANGGPGVFRNGPAGSKGEVEVRIFDAQGNLVADGDADIDFPASVGRQIHITNVGLRTGGQGNPNTTNVELVEATNFQRVAPNTQLVNTARGATFAENQPYAPRFLLFERQEEQPDSFIPMKGIAGVGYLIDEDKPSEALLMADTNDNGVIDEDDTEIGEIKLDGPSGSSRGRILDTGLPLTTSGDGITGPNGSVLSIPIAVGARTGVYALEIELEDGGESVIHIVVE